MENGGDAWEAAVVASFHKLALTTPGSLNLDPAANEERELRHRQFHHTLVAACSSRTYSAIKKQFLSDSRTTESGI